MDLKEFALLLRASWIVLLACVIAGTAVSLSVSLLQQPVYESTAKVYVSTQQATSVQDLSQGSSFTQQVVKSYADVATAPIVLQPVITQLKLDTSPTELAERVTAEAPLDTVLLEITASDRSPVQAARIANAVSASLSNVVAQLTPATVQTDRSPVKVTRIQAAMAPEAPSSPRLLTNTALGAAAGLVIAILFIVLRRRLDTRVRAERDVADVTDVPVLGAIAFDQTAADSPLAVRSDPTGLRAEAFRSLRTNLQFLNSGAGAHALVITSSLEGEGKTTSTLNLALAIADAGKRVVIVDADLRRPRVATYLGIEGGLGLTDVLISQVELDSALQQWGEGTLAVLPAGQIPPNPSELLQSQRMQDVIAALTERFDYLLIDAPPILPVSDAAILGREVGGVLMVAAADRVDKRQLSAAFAALGKVDVRPSGVVLTMVRRSANPYEYAYEAVPYGERSDRRPASTPVALAD